MTDGGAGDAPAGEGAFGFVEPEQAEAMQAADASGNIADNPGVIGGTDGEPIGNIESIEGEVWAIRADGERVQLELGDEVYQGDILESGPEGNVGVLLADETTFAMGPEGRMVLDEMVYDPGTQEGSVSMSVLQGVFTFVSGQVAKTDPDAMTLDTPVATIGIRGTQVGLDLSDGQNLNVHLMEELFGFVGEVVVANDGGVQVLNDANAFTSVSSFDSSPSDFQIVTVEDILASYGESTLPYLPTRNSDGERTSANTFEQQPEIDGEDRESLEFLNDFQTDAGGEDENVADIKVVGDYQGITQIEQLEADNTDVNPFLNDGQPIVGTGGGNRGGTTDTDDDDEVFEPIVTTEFMSRFGDCEDYAILKYLSLRRLGWKEKQLRVVAVKDLNLKVGHAVLVVLFTHPKTGQILPLLLDNQIKKIVAANKVRHYQPVFSLNKFFWWKHTPATS